MLVFLKLCVCVDNAEKERKTDVIQRFIRSQTYLQKQIKKNCPFLLAFLYVTDLHVIGRI